jgi:tetratricopeptide (TPR) repeat protein
MKKLLLLFLYIAFTTNARAIGDDDFAKGMQYKKAENYIEASKYLSKALLASPDNINYKTELAEVQYIRNARAEAITLYQQLLSTDKNNAVFKTRLVVLYSDTKNYKAAIDLGSDFSQKKIPSSELFNYNYKLAEAYNAVKIFPKAIEYYSIAQSYNTNNIDIDYKLARAYGEIDNYEKALPYFEKSLLTKTNDANKTYEMGMMYYNAQQHAKAIEFFQKALDLGYPASLIYYYDLANVYYEVKQYEQCILALEKAKEFSPYDQDIASLRAYCYYDMGKLKEARKAIDEMLELNPKNADLIYLYGLTYQKGGDLNKAEKYFDKAFVIKPALETLRVSHMKF